MDVIEFLQQEHRNARSAFEKLVATPPAEREALWRELGRELRTHEKLEEQGLYGPIARDGTSDPALFEWVSDRHQDEVYEVEGLIEEADGLDPEDGRWLAAVRQIRAALENHIRQEERDIFPRIGQRWNRTRLEEAGREMRQSKADRRPSPRTIPLTIETRGGYEAMEPREPKPDVQEPEMDERPEDVIPEDDDPIDPDDDDTLGRPVHLEP